MNKEQEKFLTIEFPYQGWDSVEQLEDIIGEEDAANLLFDEENEYILEITFKRIAIKPKNI